jgi:hypothetical protein
VPGVRTIEFRVSDGHKISNPGGVLVVTRVNVTLVNDIPAIYRGITGAPLFEPDHTTNIGGDVSFNTSFLENHGAVKIFPDDIDIADDDDALLSSVSVTIDGVLEDGAEEILYDAAVAQETGLTAIVRRKQRYRW